MEGGVVGAVGMDVCAEIENDELFGEILSGKFVGGSFSASERIRRLNAALDLLNGSLERQVASGHGELLASALGATGVERAVQDLRREAAVLRGDVERLREAVRTPYADIERDAGVLGRIRAVRRTAAAAREVLRLHDRLESCRPADRPALLYEIGARADRGDLDGVELVERELADAEAARAETSADADARLRRGLAEGDAAAVAEGLAALDGLRRADDAADGTVAAELETATRAIRAAVAEDGLWEALETLFDDALTGCCRRIALLQAGLNGLRPSERRRRAAERFRRDLSATLAAELERSPKAVRRAIEADFPRLIARLERTRRRLGADGPAVERDRLAVWENAFLSDSLARLLGPVRAIWRRGRSPDPEDVDEAVRAIAGALGSSSGDRRLGVALALNVAKAVKQMCAEAEQRVRLDEDAGRASAAPTASQRANADVSNALHRFSGRIDRAVANMLNILPPESVDIIRESLEGVSRVSALTPLRLSTEAAIGLIVGSMREEIGRGAADPSKRSAYAKELQQFLTRFKDAHLSMFEDPIAVGRCSEGVVGHAVNTFILNVCSLGPTAEEWRARIAADCLGLEATLTKFESSADRPARFRELRAMHNFLQSTPAEILSKQTKSRPLPPSLAMLTLFLYAGSDLTPPHVCAGWTHDKAVAWLHEHENEKERIEFVAGALQRYSQYVNQHNITKYDDVYPVLLQLLEDARKTC